MSTDKQSEHSPEDQVARCREFASARGWLTPDSLVFIDAGISGAARANRPGLLAMLDRIGEWDALLVFDDSRLARNGEDFHWALNQLEDHGRIGFDVSTGAALADLGTQVKSLLSAEQRKKIAADTWRGLRGQMDRGLATGGVAYGYRIERDERDAAHIVVAPDEAEVIRRLFRLYAEGDGIKAIAHRLNAEGVPPPKPRAMRSRAASWAPTSIREMLRNEQYRGVRIWNKTKWHRPRAGGRRRITRPESEWVRQTDERLRIIDEALWQAVRTVADQRAGQSRAVEKSDGRVHVVPAREHNPRRRHLLSGLLVCGECGGSFCALREDALMGCSWRHARGASVCSSTIRVPASEIEHRVIGAIRSQILVPDHLAYLAARTMEEIRSVQRPSDAERASLIDIERQVGRLVDAVAIADDVPELVARLRETRARRDALRFRIEAAEVDLAADDIATLVADEIAGLQAVFEGERDDCRRVLEMLLAGRRLSVHADAERRYRVEGALRVRLGRDTARCREGDRAVSRMVAGGRFVRVPARRISRVPWAA